MRQAVRFLIIGAAGTAACLAVYLLLRLAIPAQAANVVSRLAVAVPTTWLNGRYTFNTRVSHRRLYGGTLAVLAAGTTISAGLLAIEQAALGPANRPAEVVALVVATAVATVARFLLLRHWLFRGQADPTHLSPEPAPANERATLSLRGNA
jgi:putative flippase GtrA